MIKRPTGFDFHWNTKELLLTLHYTDQEGNLIAESDTLSFGRTEAQQLFKTGLLYANTKLASDKDAEPKQLKPEAPTMEETQK